MSIPELIETATGWLAWSGLALSVITLIAFSVRWGQRFRLVGVTSFTLLLLASCWAFGVSYTPPLKVEGALVVPVVFDNSTDLVVAQVNDDFPDEAVEATLEQLAGNLHSGGYNGSEVHVRLRRLESAGEGVSQPVILGEVIRDLRQNITLPLAEKSDAG
ncbi:MAG TPA: Ycf51 family protein [Prochlorococcus sp.]|nr:Ycf51 family protein [Prochlorococcus sp.]